MSKCNCKKDKCLSPAVLQINNHDCPTVFHKVTFPAAMGDDETSPPRNGQYRNVLLVYEANGHAYMFSSDGIPTLISDGSQGVDDYNELTNKPSIEGHELAGDSSLEDIGVTDAIEDALEDYSPTSEFAEVAFTGDYDDLIGTPTIPTKTSDLANDGADNTSVYVEADELATVATSGSYDDLSNKPTIPTVNNATLTIQKNGTAVDTFTANASVDKTVNITVPTKTSDLANDGADNTSVYVEADELATVATSGSYSDLENKPTIPAAQVNSDWDAASGVAQILNKPTLATVATSGDYDDLINKPAAITVDSALSWTSQNPVENQAIRKAIYVKNSSNDKEAGINIAFSNPNLNPYVHIGSKSSATKGNNSVGIGYNAEAPYVRSVAIGNAAKATSRESVALGPNATAGQYSLSIGYYTNTVPDYSTAVGPFAKVLSGATNATAIGYQSEASEAETVSVGKSTNKRRIVNVADGTTATDAATVGQIPTKTSDLTNDGADNTSTYVEADELATVATSGSYDDLTDKPTIPSAIPLYTELGENTDGPITQKASREALYVDTNKTVLKLGTKAFSTDTYGARSTSVGAGTRAGGDNSVAVGDSSSAMGSYTVAVGSGATTGAGTGSISIGHNAKTNSGATYSNSVALGASATATRDYEVNVGTGTAAGFGGNNDHTRVIAGVHAGVLDTDAVNVGQLNAAIPTKTSELTNDGSDNTSTYVEADELATVATSGNYSDLSGTPAIPTVNNATLTIQKNSTDVATFTANASSNVTADISVPTKTSELTNNGSDNTSTYVEADELATVATSGSYNDLLNTPAIPSYSDFTGATASVAGAHGLVPAPAAGDQGKVLKGDGTWGDKSEKFVIMKYGESNAWAKFIAAYNENAIVYCRASSNANPATGSQTRLAFMAYVSNETTPTSVEFQYVRSVSTKTSSQPVDQVFVYKLESTNGGTWTVQTRDMAPKLAAGTNTTVSYSNDTYTVSATQPTVPEIKRRTNATTTIDISPLYVAGDGTSTYPMALKTHGDDRAGSFAYININEPTDAITEAYAGGYVWDMDESWWRKMSEVRLALYSDIPTIPTVNNATLTIQKNGTTVNTFTANASSNVTANITVPTQTSELTNNSGFLTSSTGVTSVNGSTGAVTGIQTTGNLVTSVSSSSTNSQYPSAKLFYDTVGDVETVLQTLNNGGGAQ